MRPRRRGGTLRRSRPGGDAELQAASGGGEGEAVAWGRRSKATGKITYFTTEPPVCIWSHEDIVPLYERQPLPPGPEGGG
jgi:hypothetical protein